MKTNQAVSILLGVIAAAASTQGIAQNRNIPASGRKSMLDREALAKRVEPIAQASAEMIRSPDTDIEQYPTPFFKNGSVFQVVHRAVHHPVAFTVGCAGTDFTLLLAMNPDGFLELAARAGLDLGSDNDRIGYFVTFLRATQDFRSRFRILNSASDIRIVPGAGPEQTARFNALLGKFGPLIRAPHLDSVSSEVVVFALVDVSLVELRAKVRPDGKFERSDRVLEDNLPVSRPG